MKATMSLGIGFLCLMLFRHDGWGQSRLDAYVQEGLSNNVVLQQKQADIEKALVVLQTAKSNFLPGVNLNATFSTARGGRYAELPIGDLMNPVYATLNQMTGSDAFPQIENEQIDFLPQNYYDAYIRTSVPLLNTDIIYNKRIREQQVQLSELDAAVYARQLVNDIKTAYFHYLSAGKAIEAYTSALNVMEKNVAMNEALVANGKGLPAQVLCAKSERESLKAELLQARNRMKNARYYFNFLLNRDLEAAIDTEEITVLPESGAEQNVSQREELAMLQQAKVIQETVVRMNEHYWVPKLNAFLDLGSQAVNWEVSSKSAYYMVGVSLSIPIFNGNRNVQQVRLSEWNLKQSELAVRQTTEQLSLSVRIAMNNLSASMAALEAGLEREAAAEAYFRLAEGAYAEGTMTQIEFIDASDQWLQAQLQTAVRRQEVNIAVAGLERETASYPLNKTLKTN